MMAISVHFGTGGDSDQYFGVLNRNCNGESNSRLREAGGWCVRDNYLPYANGVAVSSQAVWPLKGK